MGQIYTVVIILAVLKLLLVTVAKMIKRTRKWHTVLGVELFFGIFESHNLDSVLSIIIFISQRDRINNEADLLKYLVIVFVSAYTMMMISVYLYMAYTVDRLTKSYYKHIIIEVKNMKDEPMRFLLEDKIMNGNVF